MPFVDQGRDWVSPSKDYNYNPGHLIRHRETLVNTRNFPFFLFLGKIEVPGS